MHFEAFGGEVEEFRDGFNVPVGAADVDMTKVGNELWQLPRHIQSGPIPFDESSCGKTMP